MYLKKIKYSVAGYIKFRAEGYYIENFINICKAKGYYFENIRKINSSIIDASVIVGDYRDVCEIAKNNNCKIKILKKEGLPFFFNRYKKRKFFVFSFVTLVALIFILSRFIWNIEIIGNTTISEEEILDLLKQNGLCIGKLKSNINIKDTVDDIRLKRADISWIGVDINGTNARVEVVEADKSPGVIDANDYCNIVAKKDAMIVSVEAQNGSVQVHEGEVVSKGNILVAGWLEGKYTGIRYVHATGNVKAKVWYSEKQRIYYKQKKKINTGRCEKKYTVKLNNFAINFYKKLSKFENYDTIGSEKKLKISSNFYLPIKLIVKDNNEFVERKITYSPEEAKNIGVREISKKLEGRIGDNGDIVNKYINTNESTEYIDVEVIYEVVEDIGTEEKIAL